MNNAHRKCHLMKTKKGVNFTHLAIEKVYQIWHYIDTNTEQLPQFGRTILYALNVNIKANLKEHI